MFETLGGLPAHPLLVHVPVVLVPLAALGVLAMAVRPTLLRTFGIAVTALVGVGFVGAVLAANSGEALENSRRAAGETISATLQDHAEMGDGVQTLAGVFFALTLAWILFSRWRGRVGEERATAVVRRPRVIAAVLAVLVVLSGAVATVSVTWTGHSGARSVWEKTSP
jgi:uncharacterized membrane protein